MKYFLQHKIRNNRISIFWHSKGMSWPTGIAWICHCSIRFLNFYVKIQTNPLCSRVSLLSIYIHIHRASKMRQWLAGNNFDIHPLIWCVAKAGRPTLFLSQSVHCLRHVMVLLQLTQSSLIQRRQLAGDLANIRRQLNASSTDIGDVSAGIDDVTAVATELLTSAQAVHDNVTMTTPDAVDLSSVRLNVTQLEAFTTNLDNQVPTCTFLSHRELLMNSSLTKQQLHADSFT